MCIKYLDKMLNQWLYSSVITDYPFFKSVVELDQYHLKQLSAYNEARFSCQLKAGYYMIEYFATSSNTRVLYLKFGGAGSIISFSLSDGKVGKRIVFLSNFVNLINFKLDSEYDAICSIGRPPVKYLRIIPLRKSFAVRRMLHRLNSEEAKVAERAAKRQVSFMDYLYRTYEQTFIRDQFIIYQLWQKEVEQELLCKQQINSNRSIIRDTFIWFCASDYRPVGNARKIMQQTLLSHPEAILVYADEDCLNNGLRESPWFKPDWNPDTFLVQDYVSSCYLCRRDWYEQHRAVFAELGERLALSRLLPKLPVAAVLHIPLILVHRLIDQTGANQIAAKKSKLSCRVKVLRALLPERVQAEPGLLANTLCLHYFLPAQIPKISLLIPSRDSLQVLKPCIESLLQKTIYPDFEIIILDNQSRQAETLRWFDEIVKYSGVRVLQYKQSFNYSAINNFGVRHARGDIIGLINNDIEVISPGWLNEMVSHACRPEIGCVGAKLYYGDRRIQHAGVILSEHNIAMHGHRYFDGDADGYQGRLKLVQNYSAVTGACLVVRKEIYEQVGGLDEENLAVAYNDVDFCLKVREAGYRNLWTPYAELYHHESVSRGYDDTPEKRKRLKKEAAYMRKKWGKELANDPCYNPNLTPLKEDFSVRVF